MGEGSALPPFPCSRLLYVRIRGCWAVTTFHHLVGVRPGWTGATRSVDRIIAATAARMAKFYAVQSGHTTGVFTDWKSCESQVRGFPGAKFKSFKSQSEAEAFVAGVAPPAAAIAGATAAKHAVLGGGGIFGAPRASFSSSSHVASTKTKTSKAERSTSSAASLAALPQGSLLMYTDGGCDGNTNVAKVTHPAGWGVVALEKLADGELTKRAELFGPVEMQPKSPWFLGAEVASNNTGELCGVAHAVSYHEGHPSL